MKRTLGERDYARNVADERQASLEKTVAERDAARDAVKDRDAKLLKVVKERDEARNVAHERDRALEDAWCAARDALRNAAEVRSVLYTFSPTPSGQVS
jgi:hypothetical protein